ncbi:hypothetical protein KVR01_006468 [Diaporthe batatas]|uniref:uncharacterized protein n=1 Tax=Diaporthe batatas TaxID=748121 RepID=UPI001D057761|nr:uncharacterized protein KVR01_006468 [Diaporthe batatas]KAG8164550.1 hypothetical protein KVR01_006468 [Diaporthe batatas]
MVRTRSGRHTENTKQGKARPAKSHAADHVGRRSGGSFHRFQDLPAELRLMVWEAALAPRLVAVKPRLCPKKSEKASNLEISLLRGIPALLAVSQESRYLALRHYTWRFTIDLYFVCRNGLGYVEVESHRRARVVMAPGDTLGLFRCQPNWYSYVRPVDFLVRVADEKRSPWRIHPTTSAPRGGEDWFRKVAILGTALERNLYIARALNSTLWDLESLLHGRSTVARTARSPHTKHKIFIASAEMEQVSSSASNIANALSARLRLEDRWSPDIWAYELVGGTEGKGWRRFLKML